MMADNDLISRALALEVINAVKGVTWSQSGKVLCGKMFSQIKDLPAVDAVPVVRCRDCKYGKLCLDADGHRLIQCTNTKYPTANVETWPLELDWYCAGGERGMTMRLVDADALCTHIENEFDGVCVYDVSGNEAAREFCDMVDIAPTIDAIPVEWIFEQMQILHELHNKNEYVLQWLMELWKKEQEAQDE